MRKTSPQLMRLRDPHFSISPPRVAFSRVDFHARSRFARSTIPEEKWGTTRTLEVWANVPPSTIVGIVASVYSIIAAAT